MLSRQHIFPLIFEGLAKIGYSGNVTVHHNVAEDMPPAEGIKWYYDYLTSIASFELKTTWPGLNPPLMFCQCNQRNPES